MDEQARANGGARTGGPRARRGWFGAVALAVVVTCSAAACSSGSNGAAGPSTSADAGSTSTARATGPGRGTGGAATGSPPTSATLSDGAEQLLSTMELGTYDPALFDHRWVGATSDDSTALFVGVRDGVAIGYWCDPADGAAWLGGTIDGDRISLSSPDGVAVEATVAGDALDASVTGLPGGGTERLTLAPAADGKVLLRDSISAPDDRPSGLIVREGHVWGEASSRVRVGDGSQPPVVLPGGARRVGFDIRNPAIGTEGAGPSKAPDGARVVHATIATSPGLTPTQCAAVQDAALHAVGAVATDLSRVKDPDGTVVPGLPVGGAPAEAGALVGAAAAAGSLVADGGADAASGPLAAAVIPAIRHTMSGFINGNVPTALLPLAVVRYLGGPPDTKGTTGAPALDLELRCVEARPAS